MKIIIPYIVGSFICASILLLTTLAIWNVLEIVYRLAMILILGSIYLAVIIGEISLRIIRLPFRVGRWLLRPLRHL